MDGPAAGPPALGGSRSSLLGPRIRQAGIPLSCHGARPREEASAVQVYTLGNESCVPFRINPFELQSGVRVETHISRLQTCFEAAVPQIGPSVSIINECLHRVYEKRGFQLTDCCGAGERFSRRFPSLRDFVAGVEELIEERGYQGEILSNLQAALVGRFTPLLLGGKGKMFRVERSSPSFDSLFSKPVVLEMNDLNLDDKALVVMFLLTALREYREQHPGRGELAHITVVEEAHNVLEEVSSEGTGEGATKGDTRYRAVQAFCGMLAEIRSLGEGLIISDQSPQKLARDALRNTNVQIAHQLRDGDDRDAIARAMIMSDPQRDFVGKLCKGNAALFMTGLEKATFVQVAPYALREGDRGYGMNPALTDAEVRDYMIAEKYLVESPAQGPLPGCNSCRVPCTFRDAVFPVVDDSAVRERIRAWLPLADRREQGRQGITYAEVWDAYVRDALAELTLADCDPSLDNVWCHFVHGWHFSMQDLPPERRSAPLCSSHHDQLCASYDRVCAELTGSPLRSPGWRCSATCSCESLLHGRRCSISTMIRSWPRCRRSAA